MSPLTPLHLSATIALLLAAGCKAAQLGAAAGASQSSIEVSETSASEARRNGQQALSMAEVIKRAQQEGASKAARRSALKSQSPTALNLQMLQPAEPASVLKAPNIDNPDLVSQLVSYGSHYSVFDRQSTKGNPLVWTMSVVYGGLTVLVILLYIVWSDGQSRSRDKKSKPDMGMPAGYSQYVL
eukprot:CAMPEP_0171104270 /NCGR_PEP_ID=MMETSP0766_2-20121228/60325_1 /TAXON_ID=439317 /ORGANISM="Gambierdiscus australes, Strain CAWD 149" /LENGTH=183 /DNA_ID=CAMNT_0011564871 /DNA_START=147 /DNA_END=698 /DNA_ORIENTATION=+